jgi:hypothetical protein
LFLLHPDVDLLEFGFFFVLQDLVQPNGPKKKKEKKWQGKGQKWIGKTKVRGGKR